MLTRYAILRTDGSRQEVEVDWPPRPSLMDIREVVLPILLEARGVGAPSAWLEHVAVLHGGQRASMFVDETGAVGGQPVNLAATRVYHAASIARGEPHADGIIADAPLIHGVAILFNRNVWF
jgi:hypothetical protein